MAFRLEEVVPWGRSFDEYVQMFALAPVDLEKRIVGCGDGPASFNATMHGRGRRVVSVDPLYAFSAAQIRQRVHEVADTILAQLLANQAAYVWTIIRSPQELCRVRMAAMDAFLLDFAAGQTEGRYLPQALPELPLADDAFDLALCSHLLFTYSAQLSADFHRQAVAEMCRVAREVRVFPLLDHSGQPSPHLDVVCGLAAERGWQSTVVPVAYEFQLGSNQMLVIRR